MEFDLWFQLLLIALVISISPGPGAVFSINNGLKGDSKIIHYGMLGLMGGFLTTILLSFFVIDAVLKLYPDLLLYLHWIGGGYLIFLGVKNFYAQIDQIKTNKNQEKNHIKSITHGFIVDLTNPKAYVFLVALLPSFIRLEQSLIEQYSLITITLLLVDLGIMYCYVALANKLKQILANKKNLKIMNYIVGLVFIFFGLSIIYESINTH